MSYLTTDTDFLSAEVEYQRLIALSVASTVPDEQASYRLLANAQLTNLLNSIPVSKKSAACVTRIIQGQVSGTASGDVVTGLKLINSFLTAPFAAP